MDTNDLYNTNVSDEIHKVRNNYINSRWEELSAFYIKHSDEAFKYLLYVNAGGTVAILSFMGASESIRKLLCMKIALGLFALGVILVGVLRAKLVHKTKYLFDNWRRDVGKYWKQSIEYTQLIADDDERAESDFYAFLIGYASFICFILGVVLGGISFLTYS